MTPITKWPNWSKVLLLIGVGIVLAAIPATANAALWYMIVLAIILIFGATGSAKFSWE